jgi:hypothetical protein
VAKIQRIRLLQTVYDRGVPKYERGRHYPIVPELNSQVVGGNAEVIELDMDPADHEQDRKAIGAGDGTINHSHAALPPFDPVDPKVPKGADPASDRRGGRI